MSPRTIHTHFFFNFFFQFASIGVFLPFFGLFLQEKHFTGTEIAIIMMSVPMVQLFANPFYGFISDTKLKRKTVYRIALVGVATLCGGFYFIETFAACFFYISLYSFFRLPKISILNAALFDHLEDTKGEYSRVRIGGSLGFILFSTLAGFWVESHGILRMIDVLILAIAGHVLVGWFAPLDTTSKKIKPLAGAWKTFVTDRPWQIFLAGVLFSRMAEACYNIFYSIHLKDLGYDSATISAMWSVGVISEVFVLWWGPAILRRARIESVLLFTYVVSALRWGSTTSVTGMVGLFALQSVHGITFGLFYVAAVEWAYKNSPKGLETTGQGVTIAIMFGLAGMIGSLASGPVYDGGQGSAVFAFATLLALCATCIGVLPFLVSTREHDENP